MPGEIEAGIVDPDRSPTPHRHTDEALPKSRDPFDPVAQERDRHISVEPAVGVEYEHGPDLVRDGPGIGRQLHQI